MAKNVSGRAKMDFYVDAQHLELLLSRLENALDGPSIAFFLKTEIAPYLSKRAADRFRSEGDDVTGPWAPLKSSTESIRQSKGYPPAHPINVRTHELENYITGGTAPDAYPISIGARLTFPGRGKPNPELTKKLTTAQIGRNSSPRTVPRPVLGMNENDLAFILESLTLDIARKGQNGP